MNNHPSVTILKNLIATALSSLNPVDARNLLNLEDAMLVEAFVDEVKMLSKLLESEINEANLVSFLSNKVVPLRAAVLGASPDQGVDLAMLEFVDSFLFVVTPELEAYSRLRAQAT